MEPQFATYTGRDPTFTMTLVMKGMPHKIRGSHVRTSVAVLYSHPATESTTSLISVVRTPPLPTPGQQWFDGGYGAYMTQARAKGMPCAPDRGGWRVVVFDVPISSLDSDMCLNVSLAEPSVATSSLRGVLVTAAVMECDSQIVTPAGSVDWCDIPGWSDVCAGIDVLGNSLRDGLDLIASHQSYVGGWIVSSPSCCLRPQGRRRKSRSREMEGKQSGVRVVAPVSIYQVFVPVVDPTLWPGGAHPYETEWVGDDRGAGSSWFSIGAPYAHGCENEKDLYPCSMGHRGYGCTEFWFARVRDCFLGGAKFYTVIHALPLLFKLRTLLASGVSFTGYRVLRMLLHICRSAAFVAAYNGIGIGILCRARAVLGYDSAAQTVFAGTASGLSLLFEDASRRKEMVLYCVPRALDVLYRTYVLPVFDPELLRARGALFLHAIAFALTAYIFQSKDCVVHVKSSYRSLIRLALGI